MDVRRGRLLVNRAAAAARNACIEELSDIHRIEYKGAIAEITAHLDLSSLRENRTCFRLAEALQHAADAFARTTAAKINRRRLEQPQIIFVEQAVQNFCIGERAQFLRASAYRRSAARAATHHRPPLRGSRRARRRRRQPLQQHAASPVPSA